MKTLTFIGYILGALILEGYFYQRFQDQSLFFLFCASASLFFAIFQLFIHHENDEYEKKLKFHRRNLSSPRFLSIFLMFIVNTILWLVMAS